MESKTEFANNSLNSPKTGKLFLGVNLGPRYYLFMQKKSHASVPLRECLARLGRPESGSIGYNLMRRYRYLQ